MDQETTLFSFIQSLNQSLINSQESYFNPQEFEDLQSVAIPF